MNSLSRRVLLTFKEMASDRLDLHVLFKAAGNDSAERQSVLDAIDELTREGLLEAQGGDFYALTEKAKAVIAKL
jgi:predicted transcriptional regulator